MKMAEYLLPNHSSLTSLDPLGLCSSTEEAVSHFALLQALLQQADSDLSELEQGFPNDHELTSIPLAWLKRLETLLQDIAYSLHNDGNLDASGLQRLDLKISNPKTWLHQLRSTLFASALQLPALYPASILPHLSDSNLSKTFSPSESDCLLAHFLLGTLQIPSGNTWGRPSFSQYADGNLVSVAPNTALPYLETISLHFANGGYAHSANIGPSTNFTFTYSPAPPLPNLSSTSLLVPKLPVTIVPSPRDPSPSPGTPYVLLAANSQPGPGAAGTHEERLVGQSPLLALTCLLVPEIPAHAAVITSPLPVHSTWTGHGRTATLQSHLAPPYACRRGFITADALPLDLGHGSPELREGNVRRELRKLWAGFRGAKSVWEAEGKGSEGLRIEMPPWGCGAFGGRLETKMPCMVMAAALAGLRAKQMELFVPEAMQGTVWKGNREGMSVQEVYAEVLRSE